MTGRRPHGVERGYLRPSAFGGTVLPCRIQTGLGCHAVDENICSPNGVTQTGPGSIGRDEMRSVLRLIGVGDSSKLRMVAHTFGRSFNHEIEAVEGAPPRREDAMAVGREVLRFSLVRSGTEIQSPFEPDPQQGRDMGTAVRSNRRKPYTSAAASRSRACDHSVGVAFGLLKELSSVTGTGSATLLFRSFTFVRANTDAGSGR